MNPSKANNSRTDWNRVRRQVASHDPVAHDASDELYDPHNEAAVEKAWVQRTVLDAQGKVIRRGRGPQKAPVKERITIRLSPEVVQRFRQSGRGWQSQMDEVLQEWVKRHPAKRK